MASTKLSYAPEFARWLEPLGDLASAAVTTTAVGLPVLVVGAGPGGLAAMSAFRRAGVLFAGVESHAGVGGLWDVANPVSTGYDGLHLVTSRFTTYLGAPMPVDWPDYPSQAQALEYLRNFAVTEELLPRIEFGTAFSTAAKTEAGAWRVSLRRTATGETIERDYRAVLFATGAHNKLHTSLPRELYDQAVAGGLEAIHSADYRGPEGYAGQRVLVIGIGNSGADIAERISHVAKRTVLAVRTSPWINPQTMFGTPCDKLVHDGSPIPDWLGMSIFLAYRRLVIGNQRRLGLPPPPYALNDRVPVSDRGLVSAIREGRVVVRSQVSRFANRHAYFTSARHATEEFDAVIFATGFERKYPLLTLASGQPNPLLFYLFHRQEPGLVYMTEMVGLRSCWPIFAAQAAAVAAYFAAEQRGSARATEFNTRRNLPTPPLKGNLLRLADEYSIDYNIYSRLLHDLVTWLSS